VFTVYGIIVISVTFYSQSSNRGVPWECGIEATDDDFRRNGANAGNLSFSFGKPQLQEPPALQTPRDKVNYSLGCQHH